MKPLALILAVVGFAGLVLVYAETHGGSPPSTSLTIEGTNARFTAEEWSAIAHLCNEHEGGGLFGNGWTENFKGCAEIAAHWPEVRHAVTELHKQQLRDFLARLGAP